MIVTTAQLYKVAYGKFAVGAYNINNMEQLLGLFGGNVQSRAPFIIQLSKGARKYADKRMLEAMIRTAEQMFPGAIFAVHLDHGDVEACYDCIVSVFCISDLFVLSFCFCLGFFNMLLCLFDYVVFVIS